MLVRTTAGDSIGGKITLFQSRDWVDVGSDGRRFINKEAGLICFNPATGLMLVRT